MTQEQLDTLLEKNAAATAAAVRNELAGIVPKAPESTPEPAATTTTGFEGRAADDWLTVGDAQRFLSDNQQYRNNSTQALQQLYNQNITTFERLSRSESPDIWQKYSQEILDEIERRKAYKVIDGNDYVQAVNVVKANHIDDLVQERLNKLQESLPMTGGTVDGAGFAPASGETPPEIPDHWKDLYKANGITESIARDYCLKRGITMDQHIKMLESQQIVKDGPNVFKTLNLTEGTNAAQKA